MGNIITTLKRFLANKNTITILGVLLGLVILFVGYNYRVNNAVETQEIPYATKTISASLEITKDAVSTMEVLKSTIKDNTSIIANINEEFVIDFSVAEIVPENFETVETLYKTIERIKNS